MQQDDKLFNLTFLDKFTKGDTSKLVLYIQTYLRTSERIFEEMEEACKRGDADDLYVKAHTVKPQVQYMGIQSLQELLVKIEDLAKSNPGSDKLDELVNRALVIYSRSTGELQTYLAQLKSKSE